MYCNYCFHCGLLNFCIFFYCYNLFVLGYIYIYIYIKQAVRVYDYKGGYNTRHKATGTETSTRDLGVFFFGLGTVT
jgi:hypothetical protein